MAKRKTTSKKPPSGKKSGKPAKAASNRAPKDPEKGQARLKPLSKGGDEKPKADPAANLQFPTVPIKKPRGLIRPDGTAQTGRLSKLSYLLHYAPTTYQQLLTIIRMGATQHAAAESIGVVKESFYAWVHRGQRDLSNGKESDYAKFATDVMQAHAECRVKNEIRVSDDNPEFWLKHRAATKDNAPGWTEKVIIGGDPDAPLSFQGIEGGEGGRNNAQDALAALSVLGELGILTIGENGRVEVGGLGPAPSEETESNHRGHYPERGSDLKKIKPTHNPHVPNNPTNVE